MTNSGRRKYPTVLLYAVLRVGSSLCLVIKKPAPVGLRSCPTARFRSRGAPPSACLSVWPPFRGGFRGISFFLLIFLPCNTRDWSVDGALEISRAGG